MSILKHYLDFVQHELKTQSTYQATRPAKIKRDIGARATRVAKTVNDPLKRKADYHMALYKDFKRKYMRKYAARVKQKARS
jgi:hypothetical protein